MQWQVAAGKSHVISKVTLLCGSAKYQLLIHRCCLLMQIDPLLEKGMGTFSKAEQGKKKRQMDWGQRDGKSKR